MMRVEENEEPEELDYSIAPSVESVEDLVKMITLKKLGIEGGIESCTYKLSIKLL
jgi:hypothetical protein